MITEKKFGRTLDKEDIILYSIKNTNGMQADIINYGAILVNLFVPDNKGIFADVVLGYDRAKDYFVNGNFIGGTIGPLANRTEKAGFEIDGVSYHIPANENGNNLHSDDNRGFHKALWSGEKKEQENAVTFTIFCQDGELGFPGNRKFQVTYKLTEDNALEIHYFAETDKKTIVNMTNHSYFNLKGHDCEKNIEDEKLWIKASNYTKIRPDMVPTGEVASVAGTPFDFTKKKSIGQEIGCEDEQLHLAGGYDHNYVIDDFEEGKVQKIAELTDEEAGRTMKVYTDLPGVQLYTGNFVDVQFGKGDAYYSPRCATCLETQYFPGCANKEGFYKPVVAPGKPFISTTIYRFV